jgi:16S rRNA (adenine1518-N6/adenine1519-N6)-dimethyltransferase
VISYEIDHSLVEQAKKKLENYGNLEIRNLDPFKRDVEKFDIFISNLPYSRSREAIEWLAQRKFGRAIVMVQQEFADKLLAMPGSKYFRAISAVAGFCFKIDRLFDVGPTSFDPIPKVTSSVLRLLQINMIDRRTIKQLGLLFSSRNKIASTVAKKIGVDYRETKRIFQLAPSELVVLAKLTRNVYPVR